MTSKSTHRYAALIGVAAFASTLVMGCNAIFGFGDPVYEDTTDERGVLTAERTQICRKSGSADSDGPCIAVEASAQDGTGSVVTTGVVSGTFVLGNVSMSSQTNGDLFLASFSDGATLDWSVTFTAYTAYSAARSDDFEDTFGNGTSTNGRSVFMRSDGTVAVAGDYDTGTKRVCFLARFKKGSNAPPSIQFMKTDGDCTAGEFVKTSDGEQFKAKVEGANGEQALPPAP